MVPPFASSFTVPGYGDFSGSRRAKPGSAQVRSLVASARKLHRLSGQLAELLVQAHRDDAKRLDGR